MPWKFLTLPKRELLRWTVVAGPIDSALQQIFSSGRRPDACVMLSLSSLSALLGRPSGLQVHVHTGAEALEQLGPEWRAAEEQAILPSLFVSWSYIETAWRHFREPGDQPWLVAVRRAGRLVGLLPLVLSLDRERPWRTRVLRHMGMWEGDRPGLLACEDPEQLWPLIARALRRQRHGWDVLDLRELDEGHWLLRHPQALGPGMHQRSRPDTQAGYQRIEGDWDSYLQQRSRNTRQGYRRYQRLLQSEFGSTAIKVAQTPADIAPAFERYLAIEQRSWKYGAEVGLWSDRRQPDFYRELLPRLAAEGRASVWLLQGDGQDLAGLVRYQWQGVAYERLSAYDPAHARHAPSTLLCMTAVERLYGSGVRESDVLGLQQPLAERQAIRAWYDGMRQTYRLVSCNLLSACGMAWLLHRGLLWLGGWRRCAAVGAVMAGAAVVGVALPELAS
ncbi:MAG: hypothetical protein RJA44_725 [Pseudomonadota bacterium]